MERALLVAVPMLLAGCGPSSQSATMGAPRPPHAESCELTLVGWQDVMPGARYADYEPIGMISILASRGAQATDAEVKKEVRPKACALGGELVAPVVSTAARNRYGGEVGQSLAFTVYAKKSHAGPQKY